MIIKKIKKNTLLVFVCFYSSFCSEENQSTATHNQEMCYCGKSTYLL